MKIEECDGNWNFMYEFRIDDSWYPCNIIEKKEVDVNRVWIFTRNGTITTESREDVRKMSEDRYLKQRQDTIKNVGKYAFDHGYYEDIKEDLKQFYDSDELLIDT